jgi:hypothetical protein
MDPIAQAYMNLYQTPIREPVSSFSQSSGTPSIRAMAVSTYNLSQKDQFFLRYSMSRRTDIRPAPLPGLANGGNSSTGGLGMKIPMGGSLGFTHIFTPTTVNDARFGFNHVHIRRGVPEGGNVLPPAELRVPGVPDDDRTNGLTLLLQPKVMPVWETRDSRHILTSQNVKSQTY